MHASPFSPKYTTLPASSSSRRPKSWKVPGEGECTVAHTVMPSWHSLLTYSITCWQAAAGEAEQGARCHVSDVLWADSIRVSLAL